MRQSPHAPLHCNGGGFAPDSIGRVYLLDNLGNVLGGLAFLIVLAHLFNHFDMLYFAAGLNLLLALLVAAAAGKRFWAAAAALILAALVAVMTFGRSQRRLPPAGICPDNRSSSTAFRPTGAWS